LTKQPTRIVIITLLSLILFRIILHYTEFGFFEFIFFDLIPKWSLFLLPTIFLVSRSLKRLPIKNALIEFPVTAICFYLLYYILTPYRFDKLDWDTNYVKREKIVSLAKAKQLKGAGFRYTIPDSLTLFPFFKSKEINIKTTKDTFVTITFYTDAGINDHYSGFVFTNDSDEIEHLDRKVEARGNDFKLQPNWYQVHE